MKRPSASLAPACPCGSGQALAGCCGPIIDGTVPAPDAQSLMRSRYSAYSLGRTDWLLASWHPSTRPDAASLDDPPGQRPVWLGLDVLRHAVTGTDTAEVEFLARYRIGGGSAMRMREHSRFVREDGRWYYLDAV